MGRILRLLFCLCAPGLLGSCNLSEAKYRAALADGLISLPYAAEFQRLYPSADHFYSYYTGYYGPPTWNSRAGLFGRYVLTMQLEVSFDRSRRHVLSFKEPKFVLDEIGKISVLPDGRVESYGGIAHVRFGPKEWRQFVDRGGDFSALGVKVVRDQPVPGFAAQWKKL